MSTVVLKQKSIEKFVWNLLIYDIWKSGYSIRFTYLFILVFFAFGKVSREYNVKFNYHTARRLNK